MRLMVVLRNKLYTRFKQELSSRMGGMSMLWIVFFLLISLGLVKIWKVGTVEAMSYSSVLRRGLFFEVLQLNAYAIEVYTRGLEQLTLSEDERNNLHYLIGILFQKQKKEQLAITHFDEVFKTEPDFYEYKKEYRDIIKTYKKMDRQKLQHILAVFEKQSDHDERFSKLKYVE